ncbi:MAG: hypothetical protein ACXWPM_06790 [Bdellovibrionota bacterium]
MTSADLKESGEWKAKVNAVLEEVFFERRRQHAKWGEQNPPDGTGSPDQQIRARVAKKRCDREFKNGTGTWVDIMTEEVLEAFGEWDSGRIRAELIQVAAVAVQWVEAIDRRK